MTQRTKLRTQVSEPQAAFVNAVDQFPAFIGGFGCVAPETLIEGVPIAERGEGAVSTLLGQTAASAGYWKGKADLYRVRTQSGSEVLVTADHQFLTPAGWLPLRQVEVGALIAADETRRDGIATEIRSGSKAHYSPGSHPHGELPSPLELVVQDKSRLLRKTVFENNAWVRTFSRVCTGNCDDHSREPCFECERRDLSAVAESLRDQQRNFVQGLLSVCQTDIQRQPDPSVIYESGAESLCQRECHFCGEGEKHSPDADQGFEPTCAGSYARATSREDALVVGHSFDTRIPKHCIGYWDTIKKIDFVRHGDFYDLHVPFFEHYSAAGLWHHNSGKTQAGIMRALKLKFEHPALDVAYYLPTYDLVRMIGYPRFSDVLTRARIKHRLNKAEHTLTIPGKGRVIFRTLDNPDRIVGYEVADSIVDELDTLKQEDAQRAWQQIIARNRQKKGVGRLNTVAVATTPEGFKFVYDRWQKNPTQGYQLYRASTYSNARNLPDGYIDALKRSYPSQLIAAYLEGMFVNLTAGAVYPEFSRVMNHTEATIQDSEPLHIGVDFNVYNCTAIVGVIRQDRPFVLDEMTGMRDTPAMIETIKQRFPGHHITVYPDASGKSNKTVNASTSDIQLLKDAKFAVCVNPANPLVKDRVMAVNGQVLSGLGLRRLMVNTIKCPTITECLEQQTYDK